MQLFWRLCRCVVAAALGWGLGFLLVSSISQLVTWLSPAGLTPPAATQFSSLVLAGIGLALGVAAAFVVTRGERLAVWPMLALVAGVLLFAWVALGLWNPIGPGVLDYRSWGLTTLGPAVGAVGFWLFSSTRLTSARRTSAST